MQNKLRITKQTRMTFKAENSKLSLVRSLVGRNILKGKATPNIQDYQFSLSRCFVEMLYVSGGGAVVQRIFVTRAVLLAHLTFCYIPQYNIMSQNPLN